MSGEVGSLAGDQVVSHERSRPADLPQRQDFRPPHAGSYPSDYRGCVPWYAFLASHHRSRESVTVDGASKHRQLIASDKTSSFSAAACGRSGFRKWATRVDHLIGCLIVEFATRTREIASGTCRSRIRFERLGRCFVERRFPSLLWRGSRSPRQSQPPRADNLSLPPSDRLDV
jgi:hypothetical protein